MQFSLFSLALIASAALTAAVPSPSPKGPPGPPKGTLGGVSQSCSASQSSIHCCQANGNKNGGKKKNVYYPDGSAQLVCSQITDDKNKQVQAICSTTVACCIGDGCIAIAN